MGLCDADLFRHALGLLHGSLRELVLGGVTKADSILKLAETLMPTAKRLQCDQELIRVPELLRTGPSAIGKIPVAKSHYQCERLFVYTYPY